MADSEVTGKKGCFVGEIRDNETVRGQFLVKEMVMAETKAGKPFMTLALMDKTGEITARVWDNAQQFEADCAPGNIILLTGQAQSYKGNLQLKVVGLQAENRDGVDWSLFMPSTPYDVKMMFTELKKIVATVDHPDIQALLLSFLTDSSFVKIFQIAPAAKNMHHAYIGGLLEHTLGVVRLADTIAAVYPMIDRSLLIAGALLHDIGKVTEFTYETPPFNYSDEGRLIGHMVLAIEMVHGKLARLTGFPEEVATRIKHLILSHHGKHEFGAPAVPMLREAFVLNFIDDLDAKMNYMDRLTEQAGHDGYQWTQYQRTLERFLFVPGHAAAGLRNEESARGEGERSPDEPGEERSKQPTLWGA